MKEPLVILDADDTLWESSLFFERAEDDFTSLLESAGLDGETVRALVHRRDMERLDSTGFGARPYLDTLASVMAELLPEIPEQVAGSFRDISATLLSHPVILLPGTTAALVTLREAGLETIVYTMGRRDHQESKFERSGAGPLVSCLEIVDRKTEASLRSLLSRRGVEPSDAVCVGNSPRSDINPALAAGAGAVLFSRDRLWAAEREEIADPERVSVISSLTELPAILGL